MSNKMKLGIVMMLMASLSVAPLSIPSKVASADISKKSDIATKGTHNANYPVSRKSNKSNIATKGTHNAN